MQAQAEGRDVVSHFTGTGGGEHRSARAEAPLTLALTLALTMLQSSMLALSMLELFMP